MKLLYITNQVCGSGGLERVLSTKASYLVDFLEYEVHILTLNQSSKPFFFEFSKKITFHDISLPNNIFGYAKNYISGVKKVVKNYKPDVVLVCDDGLKGFLLPQILKNKCPIIYERHVSKSIFLNEKDRFLQKQKNKLTFFAMNFLGKFFSKFVVLTQGNLAEWNFNNLEVIPNPLSFYPDESTSLTQKIVIAVGKQSYQKGYDCRWQKRA